MKPKLKGKGIARDTALEVTVSRILQYMFANELHSANSACKADVTK